MSKYKKQKYANSFEEFFCDNGYGFLRSALKKGVENSI